MFENQKVGATTRARLIALSLPVTLVVALCLATCSFVAGTTHGTAKMIWVTVAVVLTGFSALISYLRSGRAGGLASLATRLAKSVSGGGKPALIALGELYAARTQVERDIKLEVLKERILETALHHCGDGDRVEKRAIIYLLTNNGHALEKDLVNTGRASGRPRDNFTTESDNTGRRLVEFAATGTGVDRVNDIETDSTKVPLDPRRTTYKSFVSSPISIEGRISYGLIAVDSPDKGSFRESDEGAISLLASILAAGLASRRPGA